MKNIINLLKELRTEKNVRTNTTRQIKIVKKDDDIIGNIEMKY